MNSWTRWLLMPLGLVWAVCATAVEPLHVWNALPRGPFSEALEQHYSMWLSRSLGQPVVVHAMKPAGLLPVVPESLQGNTLLLIPSLRLRRIEQASEQLEQLPIVPLQVIMHSRWCLMVSGAKAPSTYSQLQQWLSDLGREVRLAVPDEGGMPVLWMRAMVVKTGLTWQAIPQSASVDPAQSLREGRADLLLTRCSDQRAPPTAAGAAPVSLVAMSASSKLLGVPLFADWKLPPLTQGWLVAFSPKGMKAERQTQLASALYGINQREDTAALMEQWQRSRSNLTPRASRDYLFTRRRSEQVLESWLLQVGSPTSTFDPAALRSTP